MKIKIVQSGFLAIAICFSSIAAHCADTDSRTEERMKEERRRDEQMVREANTKVKVARFDSVARSPKTTDIDVHQAGDPVPKPFKVIALLTFECAITDETQAVAGFIAKAKDLGADGVVIISVITSREAGNVNYGIASFLPPNDRRVFRANAIIYGAPGK